MTEIFNTFPTIGCIAVICFVFGEIVKLTPVPNSWTPVIVAIFGGVLGVIGQMTGVMMLQDLTILDAIATGICSGLVASGAFSLFKNISGAYDEE